MKKFFALLAITVFCLGTLMSINHHNGNSAARALMPIAKADNDALDFTIVNKTGYDIKELYIGPSSNKNWTEDMEVLHGNLFENGESLKITFNPRATSVKWDIMVAWTDGSENDEWYGLKLTEINKVTLTYDRKNDKTYASYE